MLPLKACSMLGQRAASFGELFEADRLGLGCRSAPKRDPTPSGHKVLKGLKDIGGAWVPIGADRDPPAVRNHVVHQRLGRKSGGGPPPRPSPGGRLLVSRFSSPPQVINQ